MYIGIYIYVCTWKTHTHAYVLYVCMNGIVISNSNSFCPLENCILVVEFSCACDLVSGAVFSASSGLTPLDYVHTCVHVCMYVGT